MNRKYMFGIGMLIAVLLICMAVVGIVVSKDETTEEEDEYHIVTSFYPVYIATLNIVGDTEGVTLENLSEPQTGCLHDYQLTPADMKLISNADLFVINGGGIESFLADVASEYPNLDILESAGNLELLEDEEEANAHAWMSVNLYRQQVAAIAEHLAAADPEHKEIYESNAAAYDEKLAELETKQADVIAAAQGANVIIFHEAYAYVADTFGMNVSYVLDLDEERQVSAGEVADLLGAIEEDEIAYVLAEELYGKSMGDTVEAESDVQVLYLDALNRGEYEADSYIKGMESNIQILRDAFIK